MVTRDYLRTKLERLCKMLGAESGAAHALTRRHGQEYVDDRLRIVEARLRRLEEEAREQRRAKPRVRREVA